MEKKVLNFIADHQLFEEKKTILVGVSGGPDSMALLHLLCKIRKEMDLKLHALTVDHQLRKKDSEADVHYVQQVCRKWNVPVKSVSVDVNAYKTKTKESTQVVARKLRYEAFRKRMFELDADCLALGHHGDDQIETMIMALSRTTNLHSLTGIPHERKFANGKIIRPLLAVTKEEIEHYCHQHKIRPRIDSSNEDPIYTRNDIRQSVVPKLKERNSSLHVTMQRLAETLREDERYLMADAKKLFEKAVRVDEKGKKAKVSIDAFKDYPLSLQRRAYRLTLDNLYDDMPEQMSYMHERLFFNLLHGGTQNQSVHFPKRLIIEKSYGDIFFYFQEEAQKKEHFHKTIHMLPSAIALPNGATLSISRQTEPIRNKRNPYTYVCLEEQLSFPLHIRTRRPGDRMRYKGLDGSKKVKDILIDEKIPRRKRDKIYILTDNTDEIIWLIGIRKGKLKTEGKAGTYILFEYKDGQRELLEEEEDAQRH